MSGCAEILQDDFCFLLLGDGGEIIAMPLTQEDIEADEFGILIRDYNGELVFAKPGCARTSSSSSSAI